jgi:hypothetical protein
MGNILEVLLIIIPSTNKPDRRLPSLAMFGDGFSRHIRGKDPAKLVQSLDHNTFRRTERMSWKFLGRKEITYDGSSLIWHPLIFYKQIIKLNLIDELIRVKAKR